MDQLTAAVAAIGGLAVVGSLIDFAMYSTEKDKLKQRLENWWLQFSYVNWSNFGRCEAQTAISILDRIAGSSIVSFKRWRFVVAVLLVAYAIAILWSSVTLTWIFQYKLHGKDVGNSTSWVFMRCLRDYLDAVGLPDVEFFLFIALALAMSISLTRLIARFAIYCSIGPTTTKITFACLLGVHLVLLLVWSHTVVEALFVVFSISFEQLILTDKDWVAYKKYVWSVVDYQIFKLKDFFDLGIEEWAGKYAKEISERFLFRQFDWKEMPPSEKNQILLHPGEVIRESVWYSSKSMVDVVANGLRIVFAAVFVSSFVFRPLIQEPITRWWYGVMNSGKPFFTMVFGMFGAIFAVVRVFLH